MTNCSAINVELSVVRKVGLQEKVIISMQFTDIIDKSTIKYSSNVYGNTKLKLNISANTIVMLYNGDITSPFYVSQSANYTLLDTVSIPNKMNSLKITIKKLDSCNSTPVSAISTATGSVPVPAVLPATGTVPVPAVLPATGSVPVPGVSTSSSEQEVGIPRPADRVLLMYDNNQTVSYGKSAIVKYQEIYGSPNKLTIEIPPYTKVTLYIKSTDVITDPSATHPHRVFYTKSTTNNPFTEVITVPERNVFSSIQIDKINVNPIESFETDDNCIYITYNELFFVFIIMILIYCIVY